MHYRASATVAAIMAAAIVAASITGAWGAAPARADVTDDSFIQALNNYGLQYGTPDNAILVASNSVCGQLDSNPGQTINDVVAGVANQTNWSNDDSAFFAATAITAYCPQYKSLIPAAQTPMPAPPPPPPSDAPNVQDVPVV
jgi:Protein of unknown function (DUF732)